MNITSNSGRRIRFRNRKCLCGLKAEVKISDSEANPGRLFFRCRSNCCKFFEWWNIEEDNINYEDELDGISSGVGQEFTEGSVGVVEEVGDSTQMTNLDYNIRTLKSIVIMLTMCVLLLFIIVVYK